MRTLIKPHIIFLLIYLSSSVGCKPNKKENFDNTTKISMDTIVVIDKKTNQIDWEKIPIAKLPLTSNDIKNDNSLFETLTANKNHLLNSLYSNETIIKIDKKLSTYNNLEIHPNKAEGVFYKRLPNIKNLKVVIYSYLDTRTDYKGQTFELQIINEEDKVVDKLILQDEINYECFWRRTFSIKTNYGIEISDYSGCISELDSDEIVDEKNMETRFEVLLDSKISEIIKPIKR